MKVEKLVCDECQRVKGESNHWHEVGVLTKVEGMLISLVLGDIDVEPGDGWKYNIHDLCGEGCLFKHIAKLLKLNGTVAE